MALRSKIMKLSPAEYERYYQALGIQESDLLSPRDVGLAELPADVVLSEAERRSVGAFLPAWNRMDARMKIDAAQAAERRALKVRDPDQKRLDAWTAYLLLGRVRGSEERREYMAKVARGDAILPAPQPRKRARRPAAAQPIVSDFREQIDARLRARGITGVVHETITNTTADGDTLTIHHLRAKRG
jgi:hypothetical protein